MNILLDYPLAVFVVILSNNFKSGYSILCYDCNSAFDPRCGEEFDPFSLGVVNCSLRDPLEHLPTIEPTICRSIKMDIYGKIRVVRQCGYIVDEQEDPEISCRRTSGVGDLFVTYCSCNTDLCNGASNLLQVTSLAIGLGILCILFSKVY